MFAAIVTRVTDFVIGNEEQQYAVNISRTRFNIPQIQTFPLWTYQTGFKYENDAHYISRILRPAEKILHTNITHFHTSCSSHKILV